MHTDHPRDAKKATTQHQTTPQNQKPTCFKDHCCTDQPPGYPNLALTLQDDPLRDSEPHTPNLRLIPNTQDGNENDV